MSYCGFGQRARLRPYPALSALQHVLQDDLRCGRYRQGEKRSKDASEACADQHHDDDEQGVHLDRLALDHGLQNVIFGLLIGDEHGERDEAGFGAGGHETSSPPRASRPAWGL